MRGRDEWLVIGFKAQRKKSKQKEKIKKRKKKKEKVGLGSKWGKERGRGVWMM